MTDINDFLSVYNKIAEYVPKELMDTFNDKYNKLLTEALIQDRNRIFNILEKHYPNINKFKKIVYEEIDGKTEIDNDINNNEIVLDQFEYNSIKYYKDDYGIYNEQTELIGIINNNKYIFFNEITDIDDITKLNKINYLDKQYYIYDGKLFDENKRIEGFILNDDDNKYIYINNIGIKI